MINSLISALTRALQATFAVLAAAFAFSFFTSGNVLASPAMSAVATTPAAAAADAPAPASLNIPVSTTLSRNWAGYSAQGRYYTSVTGTWIVPQVTSSNTLAADAAWVGIGGVQSTDLIQAGTQAITVNGRVQYQAWYELLPSGSTPISLAIRPGDSVTTTLTETSPNLWQITILNNTTGNRFTTSVNYASSHASAEWIEEMPSDQNGFIALDAFTPIPFTGASAISNGAFQSIAQTGAKPITMVSGATVLAVPSALGEDGSTFTVTRSSGSVQLPVRTVNVPQGTFRRHGVGDESASGTTSTSIGSNGQQVLRIVRSFSSTGSGSSSLQTESHTYTVGGMTVHVTYTHN